MRMVIVELQGASQMMCPKLYEEQCLKMCLMGGSRLQRATGKVQVSFTLHSSFAKPVREIETPPFEVREEGWGEFDVNIKVCACSLQPAL
jgi:transcription initiation factor IIF auxiliary subunit